MAVEIPTVFEPWSPVQWPRRCDSEWEAMMGTLPCHDADTPADQIQLLREAVVDCLDQLDEEDRFVLEAIWFERVTVRELAARLGLHKSRTHRICTRAIGRLGEFCAVHPVIAQRLASD